MEKCYALWGSLLIPLQERRRGILDFRLRQLPKHTLKIEPEQVRAPGLQCFHGGIGDRLIEYIMDKTFTFSMTGCTLSVLVEECCWKARATRLHLDVRLSSF